MRMGLGLNLRQFAVGGTVDPSAGYALYLDFKNSLYRSGATKVSTISTVPGYTYTRSGAKSELNGTASPVAFAANFPGIVSGIGYWSRGALTNYLLQSQNMAATNWNVPAYITATANAGVAPDGTNTATRLLTTGNANSGAYIHQTPNIANATPYASSIWVKSNTGSTYSLRLRAHWITDVDQIVTVDGTWRRMVVNKTSEATSEDVEFGSVISPDSPNYDILIWQGQLINGTFNDGGPIIATTTTTASLGADALAVGVANGTYTATYTFDDLSTQVIAGVVIAAGTFTLPVNPTTLNRGLVQKLVFV